MKPDSREKTAFVTPQGLYEFLVMPFGLKMQKVLSGLNPDSGKQFVAAYLDDILVFSTTLQEHLTHLRKVIDRLKFANLKLKPSKCNFMKEEVEYLGHIITAAGLRPNSRITQAVQDFVIPENIRAVRRFLGMASYYRRFIAGFAKIAQPLHRLTAKDVPFEWSPGCGAAFIALKNKLVTPPVLAYPCFGKAFILETDASILGLGAVLSQKQMDQKLHPVAYASRALNPTEKNYSVTELETLAVVWAITHFRSYLYGGDVTVITDHSAVKSVLEAPNPTGKHARWWTRVYGRGIKSVNIIYRAGRENKSADALSRSPVSPAPSHGIGQDEAQVAALTTTTSVDQQPVDTTTHRELPVLLQSTATPEHTHPSFGSEQEKDPDLKELMLYLDHEQLPNDPERSRKLAAKASQFVLVVHYLDHSRGDRLRVAVPLRLREKLMQETHGGAYGGHFAGSKLYNTLSRQWWWPGMYKDVLAYCKGCPQCATVSGGGRQHRPALKPILIKRPFQKIGVDIMDLPCTERGNKHVVVFQDMFTKWPHVFAVPDQRAERIARLLCEEVVPMFGVPEALLSDRGTAWSNVSIGRSSPC